MDLGANERPGAKETEMATVEELEQKISELDARIVGIEKTLFGARHGALETRADRTIPTATASK